MLRLPQRARLLSLLSFELAAARRDYSTGGVLMFTCGPFGLKVFGIFGFRLAAARAPRLGRHA